MTDRDVRLARALDRFTPALPDYQHDWQDVLGRAQSRRHRLARPSRRFAIAVAVAVVAGVGVALGVTTPWQSEPRFLEAKVVGRAEAALALPSGTVLHMMVKDTPRTSASRPRSRPSSGSTTMASSTVSSTTRSSDEWKSAARRICAARWSTTHARTRSAHAWSAALSTPSETTSESYVNSSPAGPQLPTVRRRLTVARWCQSA